jgi:uncharacterized membrane protein
MVIILAVLVGVSATFAFSTFSEAQKEQKTIITHSGKVIQTSGDVLDPLSNASTVEFDPQKYLRDFNYGRISKSPTGQTIRDFTIIAEDNKIQEISPGVF